MLFLFSTAIILSLNLSLVLFGGFLTGIIVGGLMYSHPLFRYKDKPGVSMAVMALYFGLVSLGVWSIYSPVNVDSLVISVYVFILVFCLTFMKDFKDVAGDVNSLPLMMGIPRAAKRIFHRDLTGCDGTVRFTYFVNFDIINVVYDIASAVDHYT